MSCREPARHVGGIQRLRRAVIRVQDQPRERIDRRLASDQHRAGRIVRHRRCNAPEQHACGPRTAVRPNHDEVCLEVRNPAEKRRDVAAPHQDRRHRRQRVLRPPQRPTRLLAKLIHHLERTHARHHPHPRIPGRQRPVLRILLGDRDGLPHGHHALLRTVDATEHITEPRRLRPARLFKLIDVRHRPEPTASLVPPPRGGRVSLRRPPDASPVVPHQRRTPPFPDEANAAKARRLTPAGTTGSRPRRRKAHRSGLSSRRSRSAASSPHPVSAARARAATAPLQTGGW